MDITLIIAILKWVAIIILGGLSLYISAKKEVTDKAKNAIVKAEDAYKDSTKAGGTKFKFAVDWIYSNLPATLKLFVSEDMISSIVQNTFDYMEEYAVTQLNKVTEKVADKIDDVVVYIDEANAKVVADSDEDIEVIASDEDDDTE